MAQALLPVVADHVEWKVESASDTLEHPNVVEFEELYSGEFGVKNPHMNFIATENGKGFCIFSVQKNPTGEFPKTSSIVILGPTYKALLTDAEGYEEFYIHNVALQKGGTDPLPVFEEFLNNRLMRKELKIYGVTQRAFIREMIALEQKFSRKLKTMKIAVLYIKPGQTKVKEEIFLNQPPENSRFFTFMNQIAERITDMKNWKGYRGDMGKDGDDTSRDSYYTKWKGRDVMFHIAPYMNTEQHRRLVGNDIAVLIFFDNPNPTKYNLQLFGGSEIGIVPHVFTVIEPHPTDINKYRLASFSRLAVPPYTPATPPSSTYIKVKHLKDYLMTKFHNGLAAAQSVAPMNRLYTVPRREAIKDLVERYPKKNQGIVKAEKSTGTTKLRVHLIQGKDLASKDSNGLSDPYCRVIVGDMEQKSQIKKKTLKPHWDEVFEFDLDDDYQLEEFHIICMDWDKVGSHDYMGEHRVLLKDLPLDQDPTWLSLLGTTTEEVSGQIQLQFKLKSLISEEVEEDKRKKGLAIRGLGRKKPDRNNNRPISILNNKGNSTDNIAIGSTPSSPAQFKNSEKCKVDEGFHQGISTSKETRLSMMDPNTESIPDDFKSMKGSKSSDNVRSKIKKSESKLPSGARVKVDVNQSPQTLVGSSDNISPTGVANPNQSLSSPRNTPNPMLSREHKKQWASYNLGEIQVEEGNQRRSYSIGSIVEKRTKVKKTLNKDTILSQIQQEVVSIWGVCSSPEHNKEMLLTKGHALKQLIYTLKADTEIDESSKLEVIATTTNFLRLSIAYTKQKLEHSETSELQRPLETAFLACQNSIAYLQNDK